MNKEQAHDTSRQILIIEDDNEIRDALCEILRFEGYDVKTARNGQEGLEYLRSNPAPKLILLDFMMPIMNGWQFRTVQREDPVLSKIPVVVLSADNAIEQKSMGVGANGFLKKPIDLDVLLNLIKTYI